MMIILIQYINGLPMTTQYINGLPMTTQYINGYEKKVYSVMAIKPGDKSCKEIEQDCDYDKRSISLVICDTDIS